MPRAERVRFLGNIRRETSRMQNLVDRLLQLSALEGRKGLSAWLSAPPSQVMAPVFREHPLDGEEILPLLAFLKNETEEDSPEYKAALVNFLLFGLVGAIAVLVLFDLLWRKRFRAVRRPLIEQTYQR